MLNQPIAYSFTTAQGGTIALGRISEITQALPELPAGHVLQAFPLNRQKQLQASDYLLTCEMGIADEIQRDRKGIPSLVHGRAHISISHTGDHVALITHPSVAVSIDIEQTSRDISRIVPRFTTPAELKLAKEVFPGLEALFVWSCKECLFKTMRREAVHFREQLRLISVEPGEPARSLWQVSHPQLKARFRVNSTIFDTLMMSYIDEPAD